MSSEPLHLRATRLVDELERAIAFIGEQQMPIRLDEVLELLREVGSSAIVSIDAGRTFITPLPRGNETVAPPLPHGTGTVAPPDTTPVIRSSVLVDEPPF